jgi:hypothetical protein
VIIPASKCSNSLELPDLLFAWTGNEPTPRKESALRLEAEIA